MEILHSMSSPSRRKSKALSLVLGIVDSPKISVYYMQYGEWIYQDTLKSLKSEDDVAKFWNMIEDSYGSGTSVYVKGSVGCFTDYSAKTIKRNHKSFCRMDFPKRLPVRISTAEYLYII